MPGTKPEQKSWTIARSARSWCSRSASPCRAAGTCSGGSFANMPPMMPGASSPSGWSSSSRDQGSSWMSTPGSCASAHLRRLILRRIRLGPDLEPLQLGLGTHELLGVQSFAQGLLVGACRPPLTKRFVQRLRINRTATPHAWRNPQLARSARPAELRAAGHRGPSRLMPASYGTLLRRSLTAKFSWSDRSVETKFARHFHSFISMKYSCHRSTSPM